MKEICHRGAERAQRKVNKKLATKALRHEEKRGKGRGARGYRGIRVTGCGYQDIGLSGVEGGAG